MVRSVTTREPRWTEQDRAEVIALAQWRASFCPCGCGHKTADTTSPEDSGPQFRARRTVCRARLAIVEEQRALEDGTKTPPASAAARLWAADMKSR